MFTKKKSARTLQYEANKAAKVGTVIICPICGKAFVKKSYQQVFDDSKCKDAYWNGKGDRHRNGYYDKYNMKHPERLERIGIDPDDWACTMLDQHEIDAAWSDEDCGNPQYGMED